jgi:hypothetical protein
MGALDYSTTRYRLDLPPDVPGVQPLVVSAVARRQHDEVPRRRPSEVVAESSVVSTVVLRQRQWVVCLVTPRGLPGVRPCARLHVYSLLDGGFIRVVGNDDSPVTLALSRCVGMCVTPDVDCVLINSEEGKLFQINVVTGEVVRTILGYGRLARNKIDCNDSVIALGCDESIELLSWDSGTLLSKCIAAASPGSVVRRGSSGRVTCIRLVPHSMSVVAAFEDDVMRGFDFSGATLWTAYTGSTVYGFLPLPSHDHVGDTWLVHTHDFGGPVVLRLRLIPVAGDPRSRVVKEEVTSAFGDTDPNTIAPCDDTGGFVAVEYATRTLTVFHNLNERSTFVGMIAMLASLRFGGSSSSHGMSASRGYADKRARS